MPRDLDLKRRLELAGLTVIEVDGWQTRGRDDLNAVGSVHHHTGGAVGKVAPSLGVVINGRSDLPGPLCNVFGARTEDLAVHLVAAGKANHAGAGGWHGHSGNSSVYGLEEEHSGGPNEPVTDYRIDRMARVHAAFAYGRFTADEVCQHREWAPTRKPDFTVHHIDADDFRRRVAHRLNLMANPQSEEDIFMALSDEKQAQLATDAANVAYAMGNSVLPTLAYLVGKVGQDDVDEDKIAGLVLAGLKPEAIAEAVVNALPKDQAELVADELAKRLARGD